MIESPTVKRSLLASLDKLRLLVAQEIIRNQLNTNGDTSHIRCKPASGELCEQYCLKIFLTWLATKYGFPICTTAIQTAWQGILTTPGGWTQWSDQYPFNSYFDQQVESSLFQIFFEYLDCHFVPNIENTGDLYMRMLAAPLFFDKDNKPSIDSRSQKRKGGEFYTSPYLVQYCLKQALWSGKGTLIDPCCGTGNFLLGALATATDKLALVEGLHGTDVDSKAVAIARVLMAIALSQELQIQQRKLSESEFAQQLAQLLGNLGKQVRVSDAIAFDHTCDFKFDFVVTNPPYLSYGSRNQAPIAKEMDRFLRLKFPASSQYKIRLHSIFQEICLRLAKPGGTVVLLLPDAFLTGAYYSKLRELIISEADIIGFTELPESTFADATAGRWCVAHYQKKGRSGKLTSPVNLASFDETFKELRFQIPRDSLVSSDKHRFRLLFNSMDLSIVEHLAELPFVFERFRGHTGIRARNGQASIVTTENRGGNWKKGLVSGGQVTAHEVEWRGHFLNVDKALLFSGGFDPKVINQPKVLVRQTSDRLIGALDTSGLHHLNNVHAFSSVETKSLCSAAFFAALINSRLWLYLYRLKSREQKRALAQIDIEMVESMPLPGQAQKVEQLIATAIINPGQPHSDTLAAIDRLIYDLYGLPPEHIEHIEKTIAGERKRQNLPSGDAALNLLQSLCNATV